MYTLYNQTDVSNLQDALKKLKTLADELRSSQERERTLAELVEAQKQREQARLDEAHEQGRMEGYLKAQQDFFVKRNGGGY